MKIYIDKRNHPFWATYHNYPPMRYLKTKKFAKLIHCFNHLPKDDSIPFIIDCEHLLHLAGESRNYFKMWQTSKFIERRITSSSCKAVIGATKGTLRDALKYIEKKDELKQKYYQVMPAIPVKPLKNFSEIDKGPFTLLNIGNKFWGKGTPIALEIFNRVRIKYGKNVRMLLVCGDIPEYYQIPNGVELIKSRKLTMKIRDQLYNRSHVFVFPCLHDSFGVYLECLSYGVPILSTNIYDKSEIVLNGKTGFLFETPISLYDGDFGKEWKNWDEFQEKVKQGLENGLFENLISEMVKKIELLIENRQLLKALSRNSQNFCKESLNINRKNREILKIYKEVYT